MSIECSGGKLRRWCGRGATRDAGCGRAAATQRGGRRSVAKRPQRLWAALIKFMATSPLKQY